MAFTLVKRLLIVSLLSLGLMFSKSSFACSATLKVSVAKDWPPYSYLEGDRYKGLDIEILELLLKKAELCWDYVAYPSSARAFKELKHQRLDMIFAASWSAERAEFLHYSSPYRHESMILFKAIGQNKRFDFTKESSIALNRGSFYGQKFADYSARCPDCIVPVNTTYQRFVLLKNHRVDFSIEDELTGTYALHRNHLADVIKATDDVIYSNNVHFVLARNEKGQGVRDKLNLLISKLDDDIGRIIAKYKHGFAH